MIAFYAQESPEQTEARRQRQSVSGQAYWAAVSEEERAQRPRRVAGGKAPQTEEERLRKQREKKRRYRARRKERDPAGAAAARAQETEMGRLRRQNKRLEKIVQEGGLQDVE